MITVSNSINNDSPELFPSEISRKSTMQNYHKESGLSAGGFHVNPSVSPAKEMHKMIFDGCGQNSIEPYAILIPDLQSLKMFPGFVPREYMDEKIIAYVAGLVDGDGSIYLRKGRTAQIYPGLGIRLGWKGKNTLTWIQEVFGGHFGREKRPYNPKHAEVYRWIVDAGKAVAVIRQIYPYLRVKRIQATVALHCWNIWTEKEANRYRECLSLKRAMSLLNRTGAEYALPVEGSWLLIPKNSKEKPSVKFQKTWPKAGRLLNGRIYEQATWVHRTKGNVSGLLPTPRSIYGEHPGMKDPRHLTGAVRTWPTPRGRDHFPALHPRFTAKTKTGYKTKRHSGIEFGASLPDAVLYEMKEATPEDGSLNPTWVDWLMGYSIGWTDLKVSEIVLSLK